MEFMKGKRGFEFSFAWLFSIIIGAVIIFLAIYASLSFIRSERTVQDTLNSKELEILLQPIETQSFETTVRPKNIVFPDETRLEITCSDQKPWGYSRIRSSTRQDVGDEWQDTGVASVLNNKFIFADKNIEGKEFKIFTKQNNMPFKIGDLTFIWSDEYCFVSPPEEVKDDLGSIGLNESGIDIVENLNECSSESKKVCFGGSSNVCDINVDLDLERVKKDGRFVYYKGSLIYGAIFSDTDIYDCNIKRIMYKANSLAELYYQKSVLISTKSTKSCSTEMQPLLKAYADKANFQAKETMQEVYIGFNQLYFLAGELQNSQEQLVCPLWKEDF